ncbi:glycine-rich domain-containing protein 1-like isoform X2 [Pecten maximus]|uniref:glycine-rich domain-containing protein 1-like isoform X2 n=1 Tax=Pecten maximus TaxID=6579 RepID=UPI001458E8E3|nr:glycine-rich domain-containing protein 1-like isoform X2 [Pecten maximus]
MITTKERSVMDAHQNDSQKNVGTAAVEAASKLQFSVDLVEAVLYHLDILNKVDQHPCLRKGKHLDEALRRYEKLWLPLAAAHKDKLLSAPLDIEWIWHCHILSPLAYKRDCEFHVGEIVNHRLLSRQDRKAALEVSKELWLEKYGEKEPFKIHLPMGRELVDDNEDGSKFTSELKYDIRAAVGRQSLFYYNVSLPHYRDRQFITRCVLRYQQFLYLMTLHRKVFLVPCYDNDLVWHTHQLFPLTYRQDTERILGRVLNHDDSTDDRSPGSVLNVSYANTCKLWKEAFGENYSSPGAMYRGPTSRGTMSDFTTDNSDVDTEELPISVSLHCLALQTNPAGYKAKFSLLIYHVTAGTSDRKLIVELKGPYLVWTEEQLDKATFNMQRGDGLDFIMVRKSGLLGRKEEVADVKIESSAIFKHLVYRYQSNFTKEIEFESANCDNKLYVDGSVRAVTATQVLSLEVGDFGEYKEPANFDIQEPLQKWKEGSHKGCASSIASHRLLDRSGHEVFKVRVQHNVNHLRSSVHVYDAEHRLLTLANSVDSTQLPLPGQVSSSGRDVCLSPANGERAFLIKDNNGDWGVIGGRWIPGQDKVDGVCHRCHPEDMPPWFTRTKV